MDVCIHTHTPSFVVNDTARLGPSNHSWLELQKFLESLTGVRVALLYQCFLQEENHLAT
jgi:hypothetical protein